jgi:RNA polymerase sigma-70 factor (ECF subfamily)
MSTLSLEQIFFEALEDEAQASCEVIRAELGERLARLVEQGDEAWPTFRVEPRAFALELADRYVRFPPKASALDWFEHVQAVDLYLAIACGNGDHHALVAFDEAYGKDIKKMVGRYQGADLPPEDLEQSLKERLFVATDRRAPKILDYSGQGFLQNWLKVTGTRLFIDLLRGQSSRNEYEIAMPRDEEQRVLDLPSPDQDPELDFLKREYREHFRQAFFAAAQALSSHERNLLRQYIVAGLTVEQLGKLYGVHTATAARRVQRAREALVEGTRLELISRLQVSQAELESIMRLIQSRLEISMARMLRTATHASIC